MLGALAETVVETTGRLQDLSRAREDLPRHEERDQRLGQALEGDVAADEVVLVAPVGVPGGVGVVLEEQDVARDAVLAQPLLGLMEQVLHDPLARLVVDDELGDVVTLRRGVLGVEARVEVEPGAVFQEDVGVTRGMTFSNKYRATLSGERRRWPFSVQVRPYSFSRPKIRRFILGLA